MNDFRTVVPAYRWAKTIKELDENKCAFCGSTVNLEAHHIRQKAENEGEATNLENGITLCHRCHYTAHGANYTTKKHVGEGWRGFSTTPQEMQSFVADYAARKVVIALPKGKKDDIKAAAAAAGESMNQYIIAAVDQRMQRDKEA